MTPYEVFLRLRSPPSDGSYVAEPPMPGSPHRIAKTADGTPAVLFRTRGLTGAPNPPTTLAHMVISHDVPCTLRRPDGSGESGEFSVVLCTAREPALHEAFLGALEFALRRFPATTTPEDIAPALDAMIESFRALSRPGARTAIGLWGELWVLASVERPEPLLEAWHSEPNNLVDFAAQGEWVEVKTTTSGRRAHHCTQRQLSPPSSVTGYLISVMTIRSDAGRSIGDLARTIRAKCRDPCLAAKFEAVLLQSLGESFAAGVQAAFDADVAAETARLYDMRKLPTLVPPFPPGISGITYDLDLSRAAPMAAGTGSHGPLAECLLATLQQPH